MKANYRLLSTLIDLGKLDMCLISISRRTFDLLNFTCSDAIIFQLDNMDGLNDMIGWSYDGFLTGYNSTIYLNNLRPINCSSLKELRITAEKLIKLKVMI